MSNFIEIERQLENARFELMNAKHGSSIQALIKALAILNLEVRNHVITLKASPADETNVPIALVNG